MNDTDTTALRNQLEERRSRLRTLIDGDGDAFELVRLLQQVDGALRRIDDGAFGTCEVCREPIAADDLSANPLIRYCLCDLSDEQQSALQHDLELAARIQSALLPQQDVTGDGWQVHYRYRPAGPVAGDYCDVLTNGDAGAGLLFIVGDVSGKGVAAALVMAHLNAAFRSLAGQGLPVSELLDRTNRLLLQGTLDSHYATAVCGRATDGGAVELCNAGHCPALLIRDGGVDSFPSTGFPLGMMEESTFEASTERLEPGDTLFIYTDGLTETRNEEGAEFGPERLAKLLEEHHELAPRDLADRCLTALDGFRGEAAPFDDLTLMVVRRAASPSQFETPPADVNNSQN